MVGSQEIGHTWVREVWKRLVARNENWWMRAWKVTFWGDLLGAVWRAEQEVGYIHDLLILSDDCGIRSGLKVKVTLLGRRLGIANQHLPALVWAFSLDGDDLDLWGQWETPLRWRHLEVVTGVGKTTQTPTFKDWQREYKEVVVFGQPVGLDVVKDAD